MDFAERLGRVLTVANARPLSRFHFYPLKTAILLHYGLPDGEDVQKIVNICYSCAGSGMYSDSQECRRCIGGIYSTRRFKLRRWKLGTHIFHQPIGREYDELRPVTIQGKIEHRQRRTIFAATAAVGLVFDHSLYMRTLQQAPANRFSRVVVRSAQLFRWMVGDQTLFDLAHRAQVRSILIRANEIREADFPF